MIFRIMLLLLKAGDRCPEIQMSFNSGEENGRKMSKVGRRSPFCQYDRGRSHTPVYKSVRGVYWRMSVTVFKLMFRLLSMKKKLLNTEWWLGYLWWRTRLLTNSLVASPLASPPKQKPSREVSSATLVILFFKLISWRSDYGLAPTQFSL